jgi:hypothetical protein
VRRDRHDRPLSLFSHMLIQSRPSRGMFQDWLAVSVLWIAAVGTLTTWGATDCWRQQNEWVVVESRALPKARCPRSCGRQADTQRLRMRGSNLRVRRCLDARPTSCPARSGLTVTWIARRFSATTS